LNEEIKVQNARSVNRSMLHTRTVLIDNSAHNAHICSTCTSSQGAAQFLLR